MPAQLRRIPGLSRGVALLSGQAKALAQLPRTLWELNLSVLALVDAFGSARATMATVAEVTERLERIQLWQQRVEAETSEFSGIAGRFGALLADDLPRMEEQLAALISRLEAARRLQAPAS